MDHRLLLLPLAILGVWRLGGGLRGRAAAALAVGAAAFGALAWFRPDATLRAYPVAVNAALLAVFGGSLSPGPSVVERLAERAEGTLRPEVRAYTRRVTVAWCVFFAVNAAAALATGLWAGPRLWALYNGAISYGLVAALFAGEWLVRRRFRRRLAQAGA